MSPMKVKNRKPRHYVEDPDKQDDIHQFVEHVKERPWLYAIMVVFIIFCMVTAILYRVHTADAGRKTASLLIDALNIEEPQEQISALKSLAGKAGVHEARRLYLLAERMLEEGKYDEAQQAFQEIVYNHARSDFAPRAAEGLAFIREHVDGEYETAAHAYEEILSRWPDSFTALRQPLNVARCYEHIDDFAKAVSLYREQTELFAGSSVAQEAQEALSRLRRSHPEMFPAETTLPTIEPATRDEVVELAPVTEVIEEDTEDMDTEESDDALSLAPDDSLLDLQLRAPDIDPSEALSHIDHGDDWEQ